MGTTVTDWGIEQLHGLTRLVDVGLYGNFNNEGGRQLQKALPNAKIGK